MNSSKTHLIVFNTLEPYSVSFVAMWIQFRKIRRSANFCLTESHFLRGVAKFCLELLFFSPNWCLSRALHKTSLSTLKESSVVATVTVLCVGPRRLTLSPLLLNKGVTWMS